MLEVDIARTVHRESGQLGCLHHPGVPAPHLALFYDGDDEYVDGVLRFLEPGLEASEPIAIAVPGPRAQLLRDEIDASMADVEFLDMVELGRNPARIIPAVLTMIERHRGSRLHYIGEPVWPGRSREEIQEATRHEALINLAWPGADIRVLCPYDAAGLDDVVLHDAEITHPWLVRRGATVPSGAYTGASFPTGTDNPLPDPPADAIPLDFGLRDLANVRALVTARAAAAGLGRDRADDLVIAVNEVASNAIKYGTSGGRLRVWSTDRAVICQLEDPGHIIDPLAGRHRPVAGLDGGIGLWMVNHLCDLAEVRTGPRGTTIRLHARLR